MMFTPRSAELSQPSQAEGWAAPGRPRGRPGAGGLALTGSPPNGCFDPVGGFFRCLMLPDAHHRPAGFAKRCVYPSIPGDVCLELRAPELRVGLRPGRVLRTAMPEAAIDVDGDPLLQEHEVGAGAQVRCRSTVLAVAQPSAEQDPANRHLGVGVLAPDSFHSTSSSG